MATLDINIIVATTAAMGIGRHGGLPWTNLKKEMAYFARVTKKPSSLPSTRNVVIMGRATWESIPPKFRPLANRLNIVLSRSVPAPGIQVPATADEPVRAVSMAHALDYIQKHHISSVHQALAKDVTKPPTLPPPRARVARQDAGDGEETMVEEAVSGALDRVFVIGGAQVYAEALRSPLTRRILRTRINENVDCDVFFPLVLPATTADADSDTNASAGSPTDTDTLSPPNPWKKRSHEALRTWVGDVSIPEGTQSENGFTYEFELWERDD